MQQELEWKSVPVGVRFISEEVCCASSGVVFARFNNGVVDGEYMVTLSHLTKEQLSKYRIYVTGKDLIKKEDVYWHPATVDFHSSVVRGSYGRAAGRALADFVKDLLVQDFITVPGGHSLAKRDFDVFVVGLRLTRTRLTDVFPLSEAEPVEFGGADEQSSIAVEAFPFSFTNPLIFSKFSSFGTVISKVKMGGVFVGYLSDVKYLENSAGAQVKISRSPKSIGLLMGALRKRNGDGEFAFILSWSQLLHILNMNRISIPWQASAASPAGNLLSKCSVFPVVVSDKTSSVWGSCVYLGNSTFASNFHVVESYVKNRRQVSCRIKLSRGLSIRISQEDEILVPFKSIDLVFIRLRRESRARLATAGVISPSIDYNYKIGDRVSAIGFGLYYNESLVSPLQTMGHILAKHESHLFEDSAELSTSLIATSNSCWNGSSGGALISRETGALIGLVCSNIEVALPEPMVSQENKIEKVPNFTFAIPIEVVVQGLQLSREDSSLRRINPHVEKMWTITPYHNDIIVEKVKL
ncbi:Piso0_002461 [Millerozyma farinosa CBS 7064]|uniref:Piso0_002461 protein n=1 Tax=Pichia sorbitophila (strain ATCC MYA-4447 / BCRC 22081 / CBS 7064 / NBRC 10061 / NRRL Y-12695) TaxID=559304 RepID=G8YCN8_PICSO|nr:Piso0_002461 [Millerozyma farinosa CBS 7064]